LRRGIRSRQEPLGSLSAALGELRDLGGPVSARLFMPGAALRSHSVTAVKLSLSIRHGMSTNFAFSSAVRPGGGGSGRVSSH
jgi:hypothetical protein